MTGLRPRSRLVNFRLTEEEYGRLTSVCARKGSPSISDFARASILGAIEAEASHQRPEDGQLASLRERLAELERSFQRLAQPAENRSSSG